MSKQTDADIAAEITRKERGGAQAEDPSGLLREIAATLSVGEPVDANEASIIAAIEEALSALVDTAGQLADAWAERAKAEAESAAFSLSLHGWMTRLDAAALRSEELGANLREDVEEIIEEMRGALKEALTP